VFGKRAEVVKGISGGAPRIISWNITLRCPLKCAHCYVDAGCSGGCRVRAYAQSGDFAGEDPFCYVDNSDDDRFGDGL